VEGTESAETNVNSPQNTNMVKNSDTNSTEESNEETMELKTQVCAALTAATLALSTGSNVALSSSLIPLLIREEELVTDFKTASWLATVFLITAIPSSVFGGICSDKFGRRRTAMVACLPLVAGWIVLSTATSFQILLLGRCLCSFAVWLGYPSSTIFISEVVHPKVRGTLAVFPSMLLSIGMFITYLLGYLCSSWRLICWILVFQPILTFLSMSLMKESPYWLVQNGRKEEALESLQWYRGKRYNVTEELNEIVKKKEENKKIPGFKEKIDIVFSRSFLRALSCSGVPFAMAQFTGISALVLFMVNMFQEAGLSFDPKLAPVLVGGTRIVFSLCSSIALRKGNRKYIFCTSAMALCLCTLCMGVLQVYRATYETDQWIIGFLPFPLIIIMFIAHSFGINPILHLISSEVFPTSIRSLGYGVTLCLATSANALQSFLFPYVLSWVDTAGCFFWFSISAFILVIYAFIILPDNRGLSLTNIERGMNQEKKTSLMQKQ